MWMIVICEVVGEIVEVQHGLNSLEKKPIILFHFFSLFFFLFFFFIDRATQKEEWKSLDVGDAWLSTT